MKSFIRRDRRRGPEGEELPPRPLTRVEKLRAQVFLGETFKIKSNFVSKFTTLVCEIFQFNLFCGIFFTFHFVDSPHSHIESINIAIHCSSGCATKQFWAECCPGGVKSFLITFINPELQNTTKHKHGCSFYHRQVILELVWSEITYPHPTTTFQSDCWNPI